MRKVYKQFFSQFQILSSYQNVAFWKQLSLSQIDRFNFKFKGKICQFLIDSFV
jgi:hypothetical protein